jgi:hypothetical protein
MLKDAGNTAIMENTQKSRDIKVTVESRDNKDDRESRDNEEDENDTKQSRDNDDDDTRESKNNKEDDSTTRAHRHGHRRGGKDFCDNIYVVDEEFNCAKEVKDAIEDTFSYTNVHLDNNCKQADDDEEVCLEISDSHNCDNVVNDALDEVDEFCFSDDDDKSE